MSATLGGRLAVAVGIVAVVLATAAGAQAATQTRYSLADGCYALQSPGGQAVAGADHVRMQATDARAATCSTARTARSSPRRTTAASRPRPAPEPGGRLARRRRPRGGAFTPDARRRRAGRVRDVALRPGRRAAPSTPRPSSTPPARRRRARRPYGEVGGLVEGHMHWMTFEYLGGNFHCGRPWDPYGIPYALPDCSSIEGPQGTAAPVQNFLNYGNPAPAARHDAATRS